MEEYHARGPGDCVLSSDGFDRSVRVKPLIPAAHPQGSENTSSSKWRRCRARPRGHARRHGLRDTWHAAPVQHWGAPYEYLPPTPEAPPSSSMELDRRSKVALSKHRRSAGVVGSSSFRLSRFYRTQAITPLGFVSRRRRCDVPGPAAVSIPIRDRRAGLSPLFTITHEKEPSVQFKGRSSLEAFFGKLACPCGSSGALDVQHATLFRRILGFFRFRLRHLPPSAPKTSKAPKKRQDTRQRYGSISIEVSAHPALLATSAQQDPRAAAPKSPTSMQLPGFINASAQTASLRRIDHLPRRPDNGLTRRRRHATRIRGLSSRTTPEEVETAIEALLQGAAVTTTDTAFEFVEQPHHVHEGELATAEATASSRRRAVPTRRSRCMST